MQGKNNTLNIWNNVEESRPINAQHDQIDKRDKLSQREFIQEYVLKKRPVVLKDATNSWKAVGKWTPAFFRDHYGDRMVPVFERKRALTVKGMVRLKEYVDEITSSTFENRAKYLFALKIPKEFPELLSDLEPRPSYWDPNWLESRYLLPGFPNFKLRNITGLEMNMGGMGSPFPFLHYDDLWTQTFVTQVYGRKLWMLYPPEQTQYMYPTADAENISRIPMDQDVDLSEFPLFAKAKPIKVIVEEGEMLYGAPGWWHTTQALTPSIAVVLSTANAAIWSQVTKSAFKRLVHHPKWFVRPTALPIVAYMTAFRAVKSLTERA